MRGLEPRQGRLRHANHHRRVVEERVEARHYDQLARAGQPPLHPPLHLPAGTPVGLCYHQHRGHVHRRTRIAGHRLGRTPAGQARHGGRLGAGQMHRHGRLRVAAGKESHRLAVVLGLPPQPRQRCTQPPHRRHCLLGRDVTQVQLGPHRRQAGLIKVAGHGGGIGRPAREKNPAACRRRRRQFGLDPACLDVEPGLAKGQTFQGKEMSTCSIVERVQDPVFHARWPS